MAEAKKPAKAKRTKKKATEAVVETPIITEETITVTDNGTEGAEVVTEEIVEEKPTKTAKAGKRSAKAIEEVEAKEAKEERKASGEIEDSKPKQHSNPTRSRLDRRGKNFRKSSEQLEIGKSYSIGEAVELAKKTSHVKFDASLELHINLNVDPRHADQNIRDNLVLPSGSGKKVVVAVLTDDAAEAKKAGADIAGNDDFLQQLEKGKMDFDILFATPLLMAKLGKYARTLGPRGLMPNPKSGTVTTDINKAVSEAKAGRVEYRVDTTGIVHLAVGKVSFSLEQLNANVDAVLASIKSNKPQSVKSTYFKAVHVTTTMGPSINVDLASIN